MHVPPRRNLPPSSESWGRRIDQRISERGKQAEDSAQRLRNAGRFTSGQLAVMSRRVDELGLRQTIETDVPNMSVTGNATIEPFPRTTQSVPVQAPSGGRVARVELEGYWTQSSINQVLYGYVSFEGQIISRLTRYDDIVDFTTSAHLVNLHGLAYVTLPESGSATFSVTIIRVGFTGATTTETLENIKLFVTPFQKTA